jgi:hypothetical protein
VNQPAGPRGIPEGWGIEEVCSVCGSDWDWRKLGVGYSERIVDITCLRGHELRFRLAPDDFDMFTLTVTPWVHGKPTILTGGPIDGESLDFPPPSGDATISTEAGDEYRFVREEEHAFIYEHFHPPA